MMGFEINEIPAFTLAHQVRMAPANLSDIEIRGLAIGQARRRFARPVIIPWSNFGYKEL